MPTDNLPSPTKCHQYISDMPKFFTFAEMVASDTAKRDGIDNTPTWEAVDNLRILAEEVLDKVREMWGRPIVVNSAYRSHDLNRAVGGSTRSQHRYGKAADITTGSVEGNRQLFKMIEQSGVAFDQLIDEYGYRWIHISIDKEPRRQVLHLTR